MASTGQHSLLKIANTALPESCGVQPQRVDSASTTSRPRPCSALAAGWRLTGGKRAGVGDHDHDGPGAFQAQQFEIECLGACVRYRVAAEFGGDRLDVLGEVAEFVMAQCGPDVEARHRHRVRGTRQRERDQ